MEKNKTEMEAIMKKRIGKVGELAWIVGNIICAFGNCLISRSGLGVSSIIGPAFVLSDYLKSLNDIFTVGMCEYMIQGLLLTVCCLLIGRFKPKFIFTVCNILFYGACFDVVDVILAGVVPNGIWEQIGVAVLGTLIAGFAVSIMLRTYIPPSAYEIFVKEVAIAKRLDMGKMKLIFDASMLIIAVVMMLVLIGEWRWDLIGVYTLINAVINSVVVAFFGKLLDKVFDFTPAVPRLYNWLESNSDK